MEITMGSGDHSPRILATHFAWQLGVAAGKPVQPWSLISALDKAGMIERGPNNEALVTPEIAAAVQSRFLSTGYFTDSPVGKPKKVSAT
jgi:hypothetical protein